MREDQISHWSSLPHLPHSWLALVYIRGKNAVIRDLHCTAPNVYRKRDIHDGQMDFDRGHGNEFPEEAENQAPTSDMAECSWIQEEDFHLVQIPFYLASIRSKDANNAAMSLSADKRDTLDESRITQLCAILWLCTLAYPSNVGFRWHELWRKFLGRLGVLRWWMLLSSYLVQAMPCLLH